MTGAQLLTAVGRRTNKNTSSMDSATSARLLEFLNEVYHEVLSMPGMERLRKSTTTFPSVDGTAEYTLTTTALVNRIFETTNDRRLLEMSIDQYRSVEPDTAANKGTPSHYIWMAQTAPSTHVIALWPTPSAAITYTGDILSVITDLANDSNSPVLPLDFHNVLVYGAIALEYEKSDDSRLDVALKRYQKRIGELQYWLAETATGSSSGAAEHSMFNGSYYPATWR